MDAVSYSDLRQNLKTYLDRVYNNHDPLIVTRKNSENLIILSVGEYNSLLETSYLLSSKANADHLKLSIDQLNSGKTTSKNLLGDE
jgi:antitoxin YefM